MHVLQASSFFLFASSTFYSGLIDKTWEDQISFSGYKFQQHLRWAININKVLPHEIELVGEIRSKQFPSLPEATF
jgi:hypothetical protein